VGFVDYFVYSHAVPVVLAGDEVAFELVGLILVVAVGGLSLDLIILFIN